MGVDLIISLFVTSITSVLASSGIWAYLMKRADKRNANTRMLLGLMYDKITHLGIKHIRRGWISKDDYDDFIKLFYQPYKDAGGNGTAEKIVEEVKRLPITQPKAKDWINDEIPDEQ